jgi:hypothetical protein
MDQDQSKSKQSLAYLKRLPEAQPNVEQQILEPDPRRSQT